MLKHSDVVHNHETALRGCNALFQHANDPGKMGILCLEIRTNQWTKT